MLAVRILLGLLEAVICMIQPDCPLCRHYHCYSLTSISPLITSSRLDYVYHHVVH